MTRHLYMLAYCRSYGQDWPAMHAERLRVAENAANHATSRPVRKEALVQLDALVRLSMLRAEVEACFVTH